MKSSSPSAARVRPRRDAEVLAAAAEVFYERGYADATVQDVARALGILKGSLYHYIETKEDLLYRLLEQVHGEVQQVLDEVAAIKGLSPLERIGLYVRRQVHYNLDNLERISVYYHDIDHLSESRRAEIIAKRRDHNHFISGLVRAAQQRGEVDPTVSPSLTSNCIFGTIIWPYRWYRPDGRIQRDEIADVCARYAIGGLLGAGVAQPHHEVAATATLPPTRQSQVAEVATSLRGSIESVAPVTRFDGASSAPDCLPESVEHGLTEVRARR